MLPLNKYQCLHHNQLSAVKNKIRVYGKNVGKLFEIKKNLLEQLLLHSVAYNKFALGKLSFHIVDRY